MIIVDQFLGYEIMIELFYILLLTFLYEFLYVLKWIDLNIK